MKHKSSTLWFTAPACALAMQVWAHDPSEHIKKERRDPDCSAMQEMDHSHMDSDDPVMQAMMQKCMPHTTMDSDPKMKEELHNDAAGEHAHPSADSLRR